MKRQIHSDDSPVIQAQDTPYLEENIPVDILSLLRDPLLIDSSVVKIILDHLDDLSCCRLWNVLERSKDPAFAHLKTVCADVWEEREFPLSILVQENVSLESFPVAVLIISGNNVATPKIIENVLIKNKNVQEVFFREVSTHLLHFGKAIHANDKISFVSFQLEKIHSMAVNKRMELRDFLGLAHDKLASLMLDVGELEGEQVPELLSKFEGCNLVYLVILSCQDATSKSAEVISKIIARSQSLILLDLTENAFNTDEFKFLLDSFELSNNLRSLNLTDSTHRKTTCEFVVQAMPLLPNLHSLQLDSSVSPKRLQSLLEGIVGHSSLQELSLSGSAYRRSIEPIVEYLNDSNNALCSLDLSFTKIGASAGAIFTALKDNKNLQILNLSHNRIGDSCLPFLFDLLLTNEHIELINLESNRITPEGIADFVKLLEENNILEKAEKVKFSE